MRVAYALAAVRRGLRSMHFAVVMLGLPRQAIGKVVLVLVAIQLGNGGRAIQQYDGLQAAVVQE